jgi:hypothetical protein
LTSSEEIRNLLGRDDTNPSPPPNPIPFNVTELETLAAEFEPFLRLMELLLTEFEQNSSSIL